MHKRKASINLENCVIFLVITVVISFFVVYMMNKYQEKLFNIAYQTASQKISNAIDTYMAISSDSQSPMYSPVEIEDYSQKSGKFLDEYIGVSANCGNSNGKCFAKHYKSVANLPYKPTYAGACAILNNGEAICLKPQIGDNNITGVIDVNGAKGPNILGKDLRLIEIEAKSQPKHIYVQTTEVKTTKI